MTICRPDTHTAVPRGWGDVAVSAARRKLSATGHSRLAVHDRARHAVVVVGEHRHLGAVVAGVLEAEVVEALPDVDLKAIHAAVELQHQKQADASAILQEAKLTGP